MKPISFFFLYGSIISLSHFWEGVRHTQVRRHPVPLSTLHSSEKMILSHCSWVHSRCSFAQTKRRAERRAATSRVRKGRRAARQCLIPHFSRIRGKDTSRKGGQGRGLEGLRVVPGIRGQQLRLGRSLDGGWGLYGKIECLRGRTWSGECAKCRRKAR